MTEIRKPLSRRNFLKLTGAATTTLLLAACGRDRQTPTALSPTETPNAMATRIPADIPTVVEAAPQPAVEIQITSEEQHRAAEAFSSSYPTYVSKFITSEGTQSPDQLRVIRPQDNNDTVSEGNAYGGIISAHAGILSAHNNDPDTFRGIANHYKAHLNSNGLMSWKIEAQGNVADINAATDADLDMAYAYVVADSVWGGYSADAKALIGNIKAHCIEPNTFVLKPGDVWGGSNVTNPSYFSPAHYEIFKRYTGGEDWDVVAASSRRIMDTTMQTRGTEQTGLLPDWTTSQGGDVPHMGPNQNTYHYDATRIPLRQAMAAIMYPELPDVGGYSLNYLSRINGFFEKQGPDNIVAKYTMQGVPEETYGNTAFWGPALAASIVSKNPDYRRALLDKTIDGADGWYYNESLRMLSLLTVSGKMVKI